MSIETNRLRIALQRSGRLSEPSLELMQKCGIKFTASKDKLLCHGENIAIDLLLVRDDDIPNMVNDGICEFGIVGSNVLQEKLLQRDQLGQNADSKNILTLDFGACRLALAVPLQSSIQTISDLQDKSIATSYPHLLADYLKQQKINANIHVLSGSVEIAPRLKLADGICDLVSTGSTLAANGLREIETVFNSQAQLIQTNHKISAIKQNIADTLMRRMRGVLQVNESKYIMMHAPKSAVGAITKLLPGVEHPSIVPLDGENERVAIHAVCKESVFWETMEALKELGASAILVLPVEKMLM